MFCHKLIKSKAVLLKLILGIILMSSTSCSLVRIESAEKPLAVNDLNTRLLTQEFVDDAMKITQKAADSVLKNQTSEEIKKILLTWQINTASQLKQLGFQTPPKLSLLETWIYILKTNYFFEDENIITLPKDVRAIILNSTQHNSNRIQTIASNVLSRKEFDKYSAFVEEEAQQKPFKSINFEDLHSKREAFLKLTNTPDSLAVETVGTLSEVVADFGNKISYSSDLTKKQLQWETQLYIIEKGLDTINFHNKIEKFQNQTNRLIEIAENSPEALDSALVSFRNQIDPVFAGLERGVSSSIIKLSRELTALDLMVERERIAIDSIIKRERKALTDEAHEIVEEGIKNTIAELQSTITTLAILGIIFIIIILGLPFYAGYLLGKKKNKN